MIKNKLKYIVVISSLTAMLFTCAVFAENPAAVDKNEVEYTTGTIDRISNEEIVIDDSLYTFANEIKFLSRQGVKIEIRWFNKGDKVRVVINDKYEAIIVRQF